MLNVFSFHELLKVSAAVSSAVSTAVSAAVSPAWTHGAGMDLSADSGPELASFIFWRKFQPGARLLLFALGILSSPLFFTFNNLHALNNKSLALK